MFGNLRIICLSEAVSLMCNRILSFEPYKKSPQKNPPEISLYWKNKKFSVIEVYFKLDDFDRDKLINCLSSFFWQGIIDDIISSDVEIEITRYASENDMINNPDAFFCTFFAKIP